MALSVPTTSEISDDIVADLAAALSQTIPLFPKAFTRVLAKAIAGVFILLYKYAGFIFLQLFVAHASIEETTVNGKVIRPLVELGRLVGVGDPTAATRAVLTIEIDVLNQTGTLPAGAQLLRADTGVIYLTQSPVTLDAATKTVDVIASSDQDGNGGAGVLGNLEVNDTLEFANPQSNVAQVATVTAVVTTAADAETTAAYRQRVLDRFQKKPQGGAYADYEQWAEEVEGVINAYPYTGDPGEVDVYVEVSTSIDADGIPDSAKLQEVIDSINLDVAGDATRRPVNAAVNALAITRTAFDVNITGLTADDPVALRTELNTGIDEYFRTREPFIEGLSVLPRKDRISQADLGGVVAGIVAAAGGSFTALELVKDSVIITIYPLGEGEKAKLNGGKATYV